MPSKYQSRLDPPLFGEMTVEPVSGATREGINWQVRDDGHIVCTETFKAKAAIIAAAPELLETVGNLLEVAMRVGYVERPSDKPRYNVSGTGCLIHQDQINWCGKVVDDALALMARLGIYTGAHYDAGIEAPQGLYRLIWDDIVNDAVKLAHTQESGECDGYVRAWLEENDYTEEPDWDGEKFVSKEKA